MNELKKELTELLIVLKGKYALEVLAGVYNDCKPEQHPYVDFIKRYGRVHKITGWNLIHCSMQKEWIDREYHLVEHIYKKGDKLLEKHENNLEVKTAFLELNPDIVQERTVEKIITQEQVGKVIVVNEELSLKVEEKTENNTTQNTEVSAKKLEQVL